MSFVNPQKFLYFSFAYSLFIIYGSLVPLDYHPKPFEEVWLSFKQIRYLNLGAASRADWIANIILYIPLTFSLAAYFTNKYKSSIQIFFIAAYILISSITLATTIEFCQQFFPPRTVSQNDLIAETIGSIIGLTLWFSYGNRLIKLYAHILQGGKQALFAIAVLYTLGYFALSFFPYDFVTSFQEFHNKLEDGRDSFFISSSCGNAVRCTTKLASEIFLFLPVGILFSVIFKWHPQRKTAVMLIGFIFGTIIEAIQLFLISGIAQGISIFTRILGMGFGEALYKNISLFKNPLNKLNLKKYLVIASLPYLLLLASLNGWSISDQQFTTNITEKFNHINWLPFYYHYYTSEAVAMTSLLSVFAMYLPIGLGLWLWNYNIIYKIYAAHKLKAGLYAVSLCFVMETGKLFFADKHPDPTNLIISFASAFITYSLAEVMYQWFHQPESNKYSQHKETLSPIELAYSKNKQEIENHSSSNSQTHNSFAKSIAFIIFALLFWKIVDYPGNSLGLAGILLLYGIILWKYPQTWLILIPALLPVLDFSPWTGRIFFSEFDYFIILTLAISLWYGRWNSPFQIIKPATLFLLSIYAFFYFISMLKGLLPFQTIDTNAFTNYYSHYNSLRVGKGLIWATFLLPLLAYNLLNQKDIRKYFTYGVLSGLTVTVLFGLWERFIFTGLFDYASDFRITSTFYSMHTGGAHLDAYLLLSMPFICILLTESTSKLARTLFTPLLFSTSFYIMLVTYSRGTYIAFVFAFIILITGLLICYKHQIVTNWKKTLWLPLFIVFIAVISIPILKGPFIQNRFSQTHQEVDTRSNHWLNAINMMDTDFLTSLFGMGVGSFPRTYLWQNFTDEAPATFHLQQEQNYNYLQLGSGTPLYIEQIIDVSAYTAYKLNLDYRIYSSNSRLNISICEKAIQHSFNCQGVKLIPQNMHADWQHFEHTLNSENIGNTDGSFTARPIKLILHNSRPDTTIDVKNIVLSSPQKNNLLKNGNFSKAMDYWFFTADDLIPWRTENLWVQIFFDQGWLGLIAFILMLSHTIIFLYRQLLKQDYYSVIALTSLTGFMIIGVIDSPFDMPTITLLFFMIFYISFIDSDKRKKTTQINQYRKSHSSKNSKYDYHQN